MFVLSGAVVLASIVLLVLGLSLEQQAMVYASIAASLVSIGVLVLGVLQRRRELDPAADSGLAVPAVHASGPADPLQTSAVVEAGSGAPPAPPAPPASPAPDPPPVARKQVVEVPPTSPEASVGAVTIVPGRGRFHAPSCRFVRTSPGTVALLRTEAVGRGYLPCGVCRP